MGTRYWNPSDPNLPPPCEKCKMLPEQITGYTDRKTKQVVLLVYCHGELEQHHISSEMMREVICPAMIPVKFFVEGQGH